MTTQDPAEDAVPAPLWKPLTPNQRRVLGVMIEKAKTTPAAYPMTLNAIVVGCNQKNNREPVTTLDDGDVEHCIMELCDLKVVSEAPLVSRAAKYLHHAYQWLKVDRTELAVMTELLLRGEQTLGDLRARAARMEPIGDVVALRKIVDGLLARGLMIELTSPGRGQIVSHNLYREPEVAALRSRYGARGNVASYDDSVVPRHAVPEPVPHSTGPAAGAGASIVVGEAFARLSAEVAELHAEVARLREQIANLEVRLSAVSG